MLLRQAIQAVARAGPKRKAMRPVVSFPFLFPMRPTMKKTLFAIAALAGGLTFSDAAAADAYPGKPVRIVVPFAAGGAIDIIVRAAGIKLE
jgi:hypothetical protein